MTVSESAASSVCWSLADAATRRLAQQTLLALDSREVVRRLATRYAASENAHRAGHLFEVMHALSFNQDAAARGAAVRAQVSEWAVGGSQTAASDIDLSLGGHLVGRVQAKLNDSVRVGATEVATDRYRGMQRLVAGDRLAGVRAELDRRVGVHPAGDPVLHIRDARANVTGVVRHGDVSSSPVDHARVQQAALDPVGWLDGEIRRSVTKQVVLGSVGAGATAAALTGLVDLATTAARVRTGEVSAMEAAVTACAAAATAGARSAAGAGVAGGLQVAAAAGQIAAGLGRGTAPFAIGAAVVGVAEAGFAYARREIDAADLAGRCAELTARTSISWAFGVLGQTALPVPVVGAMVGGLVGQFVGTQCVTGLQMAVVAARAARLDDLRVQELETGVLLAAALSEEFGELAGQAGTSHHAYLDAVVLPRLEPVRRALLRQDDDAAPTRFAEVVRSFEGSPLFGTLAEFDAWMAGGDDLRLDGNWR